MEDENVQQPLCIHNVVLYLSILMLYMSLCHYFPLSGYGNGFLAVNKHIDLAMFPWNFPSTRQLVFFLTLAVHDMGFWCTSHTFCRGGDLGRNRAIDHHDPLINPDFHQATIFATDSPDSACYHFGVSSCDVEVEIT